ncbi:MAG: glycosyltransferase family 2 protein [Armatimonadota bacterium]|nr:glycosyltransferase family 2 protein [Armatimonadota bacterium]
MATQISALIPAYNEADVIAHTIKAALDIPGVSEVIVIDDGSSDDTAEVARSAGAHDVLILQSNVGKGGALNVGFRKSKGNVLLILDADLGPSAAEAVKLLEPVVRDEADMAIAVLSGRMPENLENNVSSLGPKSGGFGLVVKTARFGIKLLAKREMQAPLAGPRALKREIIDKLGGFEPRFGVEVGLTIGALRAGYRVIEVPVNMVHRASGRDVRGFIHRGRQFLDVVFTLFKKLVRQ